MTIDMEKALRRKAGEPIAKWVDRLMPDIRFREPDEAQKIVMEIARMSYYDGMEAERQEIRSIVCRENEN